MVDIDIHTGMQAKLKMEEKSTGIDVETSELNVLLEEGLEKEKAAKEKMESEDGNKQKIVENDKAAAEDMHNQALECMGQTAKRKKGSDYSEVPKKKSRRSTADAVEYLKERAAKAIALKEEEGTGELDGKGEREEPISRKFDLRYASTTTRAATDDDGHDKSTTVTVAVIVNFYGKTGSKIRFPGR